VRYADACACAGCRHAEARACLITGTPKDRASTAFHPCLIFVVTRVCLLQVFNTLLPFTFDVSQMAQQVPRMPAVGGLLDCSTSKLSQKVRSVPAQGAGAVADLSEASWPRSTGREPMTSTGSGHLIRFAAIVQTCLHIAVPTCPEGQRDSGGGLPCAQDERQ
jgi:hypothetical protein